MLDDEDTSSGWSEMLSTIGGQASDAITSATGNLFTTQVSKLSTQNERSIGKGSLPVKPAKDNTMLYVALAGLVLLLVVMRARR